MDNNNKYKLKWELSKLFFITLIIFFPFPIFVTIINLNPVIKDFFNINNSVGIINIYHWKYEVPNFITRDRFFFSIWFSFSALIIAFIILIKFIFTFSNNKKKYYIYNISIMLSILGIIILSIILLTLSEIKYYYINSWCEYIKRYYNVNNNLAKDYYPVDGDLQKIINDDNSMHWLSYNNALWISGVQIAIICFVFINFQLKLFSNDNDVKLIREINQTYKREFFGETKEKKFLSILLKPTPKNVSIFLIIFSFIVLTPAFIYLLKISFFNNSFNTIIKYTYFESQMPQLMQQYSGSGNYYSFWSDVILNNKFNNYAFISVVFDIPEILLILSITFTILFIFFIVNENFVSINFLTWLTIILWFLVVTTVGFVFYSSYILNYISNIWIANMHNYSSFQDQLTQDGVWNNNLTKTWLNKNESISLLILQLSLFTSVLILCISQIYKTKNQKNSTKSIPL